MVALLWSQSCPGRRWWDRETLFYNLVQYRPAFIICINKICFSLHVVLNRVFVTSDMVDITLEYSPGSSVIYSHWKCQHVALRPNARWVHLNHNRCGSAAWICRYLWQAQLKEYKEHLVMCGGMHSVFCTT